MNEIEKLKKENEFLETVIKQLRDLKLYQCQLDYYWEENAYESYILFDIDDFIESVKESTSEKTLIKEK